MNFEAKWLEDTWSGIPFHLISFFLYLILYTNQLAEHSVGLLCPVLLTYRIIALSVALSSNYANDREGGFVYDQEEKQSK